MQRAVCTLCTSFGSWTFFGPFPFKGSAYGTYGCIRMTMGSGLGPTARRHWSLFRTPKPKVHTDLHTDFGRFSSKSSINGIDSPLPVIITSRRARRLLLLYAILWPLCGACVLLGFFFAIQSTSRRRRRQGFDFQATTSTEIKNGPEFRLASCGRWWRIHRLRAISVPLSGPLEIKAGSGFQWMNQARLHVFFTFVRPYALRMQPYAVRMHFFGSSKKLGGSRAESTCKKPYALYAPLLGVGPFSALFLLREVHTAHTTAYGWRLNRALAYCP